MQQSVLLDGSLDQCQQLRIRPMAWSCLGGGRLFDGSKPDLIAALKRIGSEQGVDETAVAVAWLLRHPAGIQPIVGTTDPVRLVACCAADGITLSREEWYALFTAARGGRVP